MAKKDRPKAKEATIRRVGNGWIVRGEMWNSSKLHGPATYTTEAVAMDLGEVWAIVSEWLRTE